MMKVTFSEAHLSGTERRQQMRMCFPSKSPSVQAGLRSGLGERIAVRKVKVEMSFASSFRLACLLSRGPRREHINSPLTLIFFETSPLYNKQSISVSELRLIFKWFVMTNFGEVGLRVCMGSEVYVPPVG